MNIFKLGSAFILLVSITFTLSSVIIDYFHEPDVIPVPIEVVEEEIVILEELSTFKQDLRCLAMNIYHEARSDSLAGQVAVADVVLNRVESKRYPNTICEVVHQSKLRTNWLGKVVPSINKCQFSWYCDGKSDEPKNIEAWESAKELSRNILTNDTFRGITEGSTHYHARYVKPDWIADRGMRRIGSIGEHVFYRWH